MFMKFSFASPLVAVLLMFSGCANEQESLHEDDHEVPSHWPNSMQEAADFIQTRVDRLIGASKSTEASSGASEREHLEVELAELVEWTPEVAADTDLAEEDWLPLYNESESIRMKLQGGEDILQMGPDFEQLCILLRKAHGSLANDPTSAEAE